MASPTRPTFLFVTGAWHSPSPTWDLTCAELTKRGFSSTCVKHSSAAPTDPKNQGVAQDAAVIRAELEKLINAGEEVIVVCHSYGGVPTAAAVEGLNLKDRAPGQKGGVLMIVYLSSFAIPPGVALQAAAGGEPLPWWNITGDILTPSDPTSLFYGDVEPELAAKAAAAIVPQSLKSFNDPSTFAPWSAGFQMGYIFTEDDKAIPLDVQKHMQSQFPAGSFTATLKSSHSPFLSMPSKLVDVLEEAWKSTAKA